MWCCAPCSSQQIIRYNPFPSNSSSHTDKFYDDEGAYEEELARTISQVLKNCKGYSACELMKTMNNVNGQLQSPSENPQSSNFSLYFNNIDGNKTNFNSLIVDLNRIGHQFSAIGLAETNIDSSLSNLYQIPDYSSFYQSTIEGKEKGTGVALYVNKVFNSEIIEECNTEPCLKSE